MIFDKIILHNSDCSGSWWYVGWVHIYIYISIMCYEVRWKFATIYLYICMYIYIYIYIYWWCTWDVRHAAAPGCMSPTMWMAIWVFRHATFTLQHTSTHCNTLQHTATHCNTLQHTATHCNTPQRNVTISVFWHATFDFTCTVAMYSQLQIGWHSILRLFLKTFNLVPGVPGFSWDSSFINWY